MAAAAILKKSKNHHISVAVQAISTKFGQMTHSSTFLTVPIVKNLKFQKFNTAAAAI